MPVIIILMYHLYAFQLLHRLYTENQDCGDDTGTVKFASDVLLEALTNETPNPQLQRTAVHDWVALVRTFYGILHPTAVQALLNLPDYDIQVH